MGPPVETDPGYVRAIDEVVRPQTVEGLSLFSRDLPGNTCRAAAVKVRGACVLGKTRRLELCGACSYATLHPHPAPPQ